MDSALLGGQIPASLSDCGTHSGDRPRAGKAPEMGRFRLLAFILVVEQEAFACFCPWKNRYC